MPTYDILEKAELQRQLNDQWMPEVGRGRDEYTEHRGFLDSETIPCDTAVVDTCHCTFVKIHRMYNIKSEP